MHGVYISVGGIRCIGYAKAAQNVRSECVCNIAYTKLTNSSLSGPCAEPRYAGKFRAQREPRASGMGCNKLHIHCPAEGSCSDVQRVCCARQRPRWRDE